MANLHKTINELFTGIADAIREKKGSSDLIVADTFPSEIEKLRTGFDYNNHDITTLPDYAFYSCEDLNSVDCYNLTGIGASAYENCTNLKTVILYDGVTSVGENAFKGCNEDLVIYCMFDSKPETWHENWNPDNCEVVYLGGAVETWDISATENDNVTAKLYNDINNEEMYSLIISGSGKMGAYNWNTIPWYDYKDNLTSAIIYDSVTSIGNRAFSGCTGLTSITIPDGVTSICDDAFYGCTGLTEIIIPDSVTSIGNRAFYNTGYYNKSNWENDVLYIGNHLIKAKEKLSESYAIKDGVLVIGDCAFYNCTSLTSITIPNSITSIGDYVFGNCKSLTSINIPNSVTSIGDYAFYYCTGLTSITISDGVTSIGSYAFNNCSSLTSITIPDSVTSIGRNAFENCKSLTSITISDGVTSIGNYAFYGCTSLTLITLPNSVTSIGDAAFYNCTSLTSINIPDSVTSICYSAFGGCTSLTSITIPNSITSIGDYVFGNCQSLTSINIPDSITSICRNAFYGCSSLTSITFEGTIAQWNAITKGTDWNYNVPATYVQCSDGQVAL